MLRRRAKQLMDSERADHTLTPTALVHEAYLRVADRRSGFEGRRHFYNAAAQAMRRILVENARARGRAKRGGGAARADDVSLDTLEAQHALTSDAIDWLALDEALDALRSRDQRRHQVVMLRFFAGLGEAEVAELLGVDVRTVRRDWVTAKLWLYAHLSGDPKAA
jgi:RNA polymerase sigma factor (TIGR02999 family)